MKPMSTMAAKLSPSATTMIRMDHAHAVALFHKVTPDASESVRDGAIKNLLAALEIHAQLEEELFYPCLRDNGVQSEALDKAVPEHAEMKSLIAKVRSLEGQRAAQDDAVCALVNAVLHHVADEETMLLPAAERFVGQQKLSELGAEMTKRRIELAKPRAAELAGSMVKAMPVKTAVMAVGALLAGGLLLGGLRSRSNQHQLQRHWAHR